MNCSAWVTVQARTRKQLSEVVYTVCFALLAAPFVTSAEDRETLQDAAARMQYAYYTADVQALRAASAALESHEGAADALTQYHLAYAQWRLSELNLTPGVLSARSTDKAAGAKAARACTEHAQAAISADARFAEAHALLAACEGFGGSKLSCRGRPLRTAAELAPNNPRVRLIETLCSEKARDPEALRAVVARFETHSMARSTAAPEWGHAEALALLGASWLERGDSLAARDALERALVIAPDYRRAQELLQLAAARPH